MKKGNPTVIFTIANELTGGSKRTTDFAVYGKPILHLAAERPAPIPALCSDNSFSKTGREY
jgi:hypothetical protein